MASYGDPSVFTLENDKIWEFDLVDSIIEFLRFNPANVMAIKALSRGWRWAALMAFHWEGVLHCHFNCKKHLLLNPTKLQRPGAPRFCCCDIFDSTNLCSCNIPKCLKNKEELVEKVGGYPSFEFLAIDIGGVLHTGGLDNVFFESWPQDHVVAIRSLKGAVADELLQRFGPRNLRLLVAGKGSISKESLAACRKLRWLDVSRAYSNVNSETVSAIIQLGELRHLNISYASKFPKGKMGLLSDSLPQIESLSMKEMAMTNEVEAASRLRNLKKLSFSSSYGITDEAITSLVMQGVALEELNAAGCDLSEKGITMIAEIKTLRKLDITFTENTDASFDAITQSLQHLEVLRMSGRSARYNGARITPASIALLGTRMTALRDLTLVSHPDDATPSDTDALANLTQLRFLDLNHSAQTTAEHLSFISKLTNLEKLDLSGCRILDNLRFVENLAKLQNLNLFLCEDLDCLRSVEKLTNLRSLLLDSCSRLSGGDLLFVEPLTQLTELNLKECKKVTSDGMAHLAQLSQMEVLNLCRCAIDDKALHHIKAMTKLRVLDLEGACITDGGLSIIGEFTRLERLSLRRCTAITTRGVINLVETLEDLRFLDLTHSGCCGHSDVEEIRSKFPRTDVCPRGLGQTSQKK